MKKVAQLSELLHVAYSEGDEHAAECHYSKWADVVASMTGPPPAALAHEAEPAIEWLTRV
jgi:hypothetical protein